MKKCDFKKCDRASRTSKADRRMLILLCLIVITPLGLLSKAYTGIGQQWVQDYSGDILYEIFWCLVIFWFMYPVKDLNKLRNITIKIALWVFVITSIIEVSQLWFHLVPDAIRSSLVWRLLLGSSFAWWDFPHYAFGSLIGWWIIYQIGCLDNSRHI
ncbi:MAG: DUF2809 domain-containing protein [Cyanobacteria bacterium P01_G01_bin.39]